MHWTQTSVARLSPVWPDCSLALYCMSVPAIESTHSLPSKQCFGEKLQFFHGQWQPHSSCKCEQCSCLLKIYSPTLYPCTPAYCLLINKTVFSSNRLLFVSSKASLELNVRKDRNGYCRFFWAYSTVCTMVLRVQWVLYCNVLPPEEAPGDYGSTILFFSNVPCYKKLHEWLHEWYHV